MEDLGTQQGPERESIIRKHGRNYQAGKLDDLGTQQRSERQGRMTWEPSRDPNEKTKLFGDTSGNTEPRKLSALGYLAEPRAGKRDGWGAQPGLEQESGMIWEETHT
jgi:hypothetical protein